MLSPKESTLTEKEKLDQAAAAVKEMMGDFIPKFSITLGSGLGYLTNLVGQSVFCDYNEIPHCKVPGVTGHAGQLVWGYLEGVPVVMLRGRIHLYEGYTVHEVVFLTRLMVTLGVKRLIITHATGAVTRNLEPGDIVGIRSQLGLNCPDPTSGPGIPELGVEFSPMEEVFDPHFLRIAKRCALDEGVSFHWGVSAFKMGRTYETVAEVEAMARMGADVATMSTVPEVIAAAQMGAKVLDLALVTNMGAGMGSLLPISHEGVVQVVDGMKEPFGRLVTSIVREVGQNL
ncbi:MAG: purine-nucleoside phosphorylase [Candidatus Magasanikbacteria bacterium CG10_big_fil_rev_8_21_14_0_10_47_10]|uniref:Purine nucleoside phosphorylase n=1 Tax=Candidatus Magasanikbacteria bacterium CG10_big_fil_rev_8_21_14_0_10_47_10 TaxID=1974652 RepID=A0A2H0TPL7_9BACT|nr:MAG: purine-nucleoside phosphorylase [Candidatus Magasanikbacteria bacterium CG10_big_fil_rev_8_21_14_0_10_47_10]